MNKLERAELDVEIEKAEKILISMKETVKIAPDEKTRKKLQSNVEVFIKHIEFMKNLRNDG